MNFWTNKKVLITGHTGFKGSWLTLLLQYLGADVVGVSLEPPTEPSMFGLLSLGTTVTSIIGDIRNIDILDSTIKTYKPQIIFHLAAQSLVRKSYIDPIGTFSTNIMGTVNLLQAARLNDNVKVLINVTSDKCYENKEWVWGYREDDPMGGYDPYSCSKGCSELITAAFRKSFTSQDLHGKRLAIGSARAGNVIGGGDWAEDRLIPDIIRAILSGKNIEIRNPGAIRPWQHVLEPLNGYLILAEKLWENSIAYEGAWNFGPFENEVFTVKELAQKFLAFWNKEDIISFENNNDMHEAKYLKLDCSKSRNMLNWKPKLTLGQALHWTAEWYDSYFKKQDLIECTMRQISTFEKMILSESDVREGINNET